MHVKEEMVTFLLCLNRVIPSAHFLNPSARTSWFFWEDRTAYGHMPRSVLLYKHALVFSTPSQWALGVPSAGGQARCQPDKRAFRVKCVVIRKQSQKRVCHNKVVSLLPLMAHTFLWALYSAL